MAPGATITLTDSDLERLADIQAMPKAELHVHLDGSLSAEDAIRLWQQRGAPILLPEKDINGKSILSLTCKAKAISMS